VSTCGGERLVLTSDTVGVAGVTGESANRPVLAIADIVLETAHYRQILLFI